MPSVVSITFKSWYSLSQKIQIKQVVLTDFLNSTMRQQKLTTGASDPIEDTEMHRDKGYALVTFKSSEEASAALSLDGSDFSGVQLEIRRPKDTEDAVMNTATVGGECCFCCYFTL